MLPEKMVQRYSEIIDDITDFIEWMERPLRRSFRINPLKAPDDIESRISWMVEEEIPGIDGAYFARDISIGNTLEHFMGYIYVQEASSMLPAVVLEPQGSVLDIAAAPGSKTTQMAGIMGNSGWILANEKNPRRIKALSENIERMGVLNVTVSSMDGRFIHRRIGEKFDRVLVDAPCSSEGMMRKMRVGWSKKRIDYLSSVQKQLAVAGFSMLKHGGVMVYSTCTGAPEENEGVVDYLLRKFPSASVEHIRVKGWKFRPGITEFRSKQFSQEVRKCARVYPQDNGTELFFMAKLRKK